MSSKEKRLLLVAVGIFVLYASLELVPRSWQWAQDQWQAVERIQHDISRYERFGEQHDIWQQRYQEAMLQREQLESGLLIGDTDELVAARLQGTLKEVAKHSGIGIKTQELPEFTVTGAWVLVTQTIRFEAEPAKVLDFIHKLRQHPTRLVVVSVDVRISRGNRLEGTLKVTGFSARNEAAESA